MVQRDIENGDVDADVAAIKNLLAQTDAEVASASKRGRKRRAKSVAPKEVKPKKPRGPSQTLRLAQWLLLQARTYRPNRKVIIRTSLLLLLILHPFWVIGIVLLSVLCAVGALVFLGPDTVWRKIIAYYRFVAQRHSRLARVVRARAYVLARKWDRWVQYLPEGIGQALKSPDLRTIAAEDGLHETAMAQRLSRLSEDSTA